MTTYHLTSVLVLSTSIESAAKARMASQCIGAATAAAVSLLICPWFAIPQAERTLDFFNANASLHLDKAGVNVSTNAKEAIGAEVFHSCIVRLQCPNTGLVFRSFSSVDCERKKSQSLKHKGGGFKLCGR